MMIMIMIPNSTSTLSLTSLDDTLADNYNNSNDNNSNDDDDGGGGDADYNSTYEVLLFVFSIYTSSS